MAEVDNTFSVECGTERTAATLAGAAILESFFGFSASILALLGLMGINPGLMLTLSILTLGAAILSAAGTISWKIRCLRSHLDDTAMNLWKLGTHTGIVNLGAGIGVLLGILAAMGVAPVILIPVAIIILGISLTLKAGVSSSINTLGLEENPTPTVKMTARMVTTTSFIQSLACLGAVVLVAISLIGIDVMMLNLIAILLLGTTDFLMGGALGTRMRSAASHK